MGRFLSSKTRREIRSENRIDKTSIKTRNELWKGSNDAEMIVTKIKPKDRFLHVLEIIPGSQ